MTWLWAPWLHHQNLSAIQVISDYEVPGTAWSWLFRTGDLVAAVFLIGMVLGLKIGRDRRGLAFLLCALGIFSILDIAFPSSCSLHDCTNFLSIHVAESIMALAVGFVAVGLDVYRDHRLGSRVFLAAQIILGLVYVVTIINGHEQDGIQYAYQFMLAVWVASVLERWMPPLNPTPLLAKHFRQLIAGWVAVSGILAILIAGAHLHIYHISGIHTGVLWLAPYGAITGVALLYLARHIVRGERRATYLLLAIMGLEVIRYSVVQPSPWLIELYLGTFILVFVLRHSFERNTGPLSAAKRLQDALTIAVGVGVAVGLLVLLLHSSGRQTQINRVLHSQEDHIEDVTIDRVHVTFDEKRIPRHDYHLALVRSIEALAGATTLAILWALFRPQPASEYASEAERDRVQSLLTEASVSSEDYFKLWPQDKSYFFSADGKGFVAYKVVSSVAFALADPTHPDAGQRATVLQEFVDYCTAQGWTICFLLVADPSKKLYQQFRLVPVGSNGVISLETFTTETMRSKWWRWRLNRATKAGFSYEALSPPHKPIVVTELQRVSDAWLERDGRQEEGFALGYFNAAYLQQCRLHILKDANGSVVAFTNELPVFRGTQATADLIRFIPGADSAMPTLLSHVICQLQQEGEYETFDLGFVPLGNMKSRAAQIARLLARRRFSAAGLEQFKNRFEPTWQPNYIAYKGDVVDLATLALAMERALNPGSENL